MEYPGNKTGLFDNCFAFPRGQKVTEVVREGVRRRSNRRLNGNCFESSRRSQDSATLTSNSMGKTFEMPWHFEKEREPNKLRIS